MNKIPRFAALLLCCGCQSPPPALPPLAQDAVILAFGDSLTFGPRVDPQQNYPAQLARMTGRKVVNAGISGESSPYGLARLPGVLDKVHPDLLILCHGANDLLWFKGKEGPEAGLKANLSQMIQLAKARHIPVLLLAVPRMTVIYPPKQWPKVRISAPPALYAELAEKFELPIEADILERVLANSKLLTDFVHPDATGYHMIAESVVQKLRQSGAI